ncbi:fatty-acid amide hydrolase [Colletotrichum incanum]|nr:fatty-acid amide hydrolase [Colletotrichum incanum]
MGSLEPASWELKAEKCRKILQNSINPKWLISSDELPPASQLNVASYIDTCKSLTPREQEITACNGIELVSQMAEGKLTAVETVTAFLKRAHAGHQLVNFATEFLADDALAAAEKLDKHFRETGKVVGPLHGLPISIKEHIGLKGRICHSAYVAWADNIAEDDALVVRLAAKAGAVFHVRTNVPQSCMASRGPYHLDCSNPIYGTTVNPYNRNLTSGGSSGGEGSCVALRCSVLGLGTDIGGSVRAPAAFCGSYGLRTTALRNPYKGICLPGLGQESIRCILGPLANSVADIQLFEDVVLNQDPWDEETSLVPLPWKKIEPYKPGQFTVGVIWDDGMVHPHPPITRALHYAVKKLKEFGVNVVDFEPHKHSEGAEFIELLYFPDAASTQREVLAQGGEPVAPLTEWAFNYSKPEPLSIRENWELNLQRESFREDYHHIMKQRGVDFVLCPAYVGVAAKCGLHVEPTIDVVDKEYKPRSATDQREYEKYIAEDFADAPIALQLAGKRFRDEETVAAVALISKIIQK